MEKGILRITAVQKGLRATHPGCGRKVECYGREASEKKNGNRLSRKMLEHCGERKNLLRVFDRTDGPLGKILKISTEQTEF